MIIQIITQVMRVVATGGEAPSCFLAAASPILHGLLSKYVLLISALLHLRSFNSNLIIMLPQTGEVAQAVSLEVFGHHANMCHSMHSVNTAWVVPRHQQRLLEVGLGSSASHHFILGINFLHCIALPH